MKEIDDIIWVGKALFDKGLVTGSTGNISFFDGDNCMYVTKSNGCFGLLDNDSFAKVSMDSTIISGKPSKEWPMHLSIYKNNENARCVIHTHSFYSTLISTYKDVDKIKNNLFKYTPYLKMKTKGNIEVVDYGQPGSNELFDNFNKKVNKDTNLYILRNHGVFAVGDSVLSAFYLLEEFEQSAKLLSTIETRIEYNTIDGE